MGFLLKGGLLLAAILGLAAGPVRADLRGLDYPHNSVEGVSCSNCHYYTTDTLPSWVSQVPENADDTDLNNLCWGCHNNAIAPYVKTHSSLSTSTKYGSWSMECQTCHWVKQQKQTRTWTIDSYLATGASTGLTVRTLTKTGAGWSDNAFAGYILIPNTAKISFQYPIESNTGDTITLAKDMDAGVASIGNTFAVIYGQFVKSSLPTPNSGTRNVKFLRATGANSFADGNATYDGICEVCHTQTSHFRNNGTGTDQNHANLGGKAGTNCIPCHKHENGFAHANGPGCGTATTCHGTLKSHPTHLLTSAMVTADCATCHDTANYPLFSDGQELASTTVCNACHGSGVATAKQYFDHPGSESLSAGSWLVVEGNASYCGSCHGATIETDHNNFGLASSCSDCHKPLTTKTDIVNLHFAAACSTCHISADSNAQNTIANGKSSGGNIQVECVDCHTAPGVNTMHAMAILEPELQTRHNKLGASANPGSDPNDCAMCHVADSALDRLALHPTCLRCHDNVDPDVNAAVTSGIGGTSVNCESCHDAKGENKLHGLSSATVSDVHDQFSSSNQSGEANCANCHAIATIEARISLHNQVSPALSGCKRCHTSLDSDVVDAVTGGVQGSPVNCESCHDAKGQNLLHGLTAATVGDDHVNLTVSNGCADCHGPLATKPDIISLHHNGACSNCHANSDPVVISVIASGAAGNPVECIDCHTGPGVNTMHGLSSADAELQTRHNMFSVSINIGIDPTDCALCHTMATIQQRLDLHPSCLTCHASADADVMTTISLGVAGATANCENCHDAKGENRMHGLTEDTVYDVHNNLSTSSQGGQQNCVNCHLLDTTAHRLNMHANLNLEVSGCKRCHSSVDPDVQAAISGGVAGTAKYCESCHDAKGENLLHGLTTATVTDVHDKFSASNAGVAEGNCGNCHVTDTADNRLDLHVQCTTCHTTHATDTSVKTTVINDGREPNHEAQGGNANTQYCEFCHLAKGQYRMHGLTPATVGDVHTNFTTSHTEEKACYNCHVMNTSNMSIDLHPLCSTCHLRHATDGSAKTVVINDGRESGHKVGGGNGVAKSCESCHTGKGVYKLHGLTDNNGADGVIDVHNRMSSSAGAWVSSGNTVPSYRKTDYTGKIKYGVYGGLLAPDYNCAECHASDRTTITPIETIQIHTKANGTGFGDCRNCHTTAFKAEVDKGRSAGHHLAGGTDLAVNCESCHQATYDSSSPSGNKMYQYDGVRHHTTRHAQAGNCTYCHADPRPAATTLASGYAATADTVGTYNTGWMTDYAMTAPSPIPRQPGCRLCHTNATSFSVNVYGGNGNHGFNILDGTADQRTKGLTVWSNNYQPGWPTVSSTTSVSVTASRVTQAMVHRIEANNSTDLIQAYDLGACFGCHSVQLRHASPIRGVDYNSDKTANNHIPYDVIRYAPGRSVFGNGYDLKGTFTSTESWKDHDWQYKACDGQNCESRGKGWLKDVQSGSNPKSWGTGVAGDTLLQVPSHSAVNNFELLTGMPTAGTMNTDSDIYYFADIAAPATLDNIHVSKALYNGTTLVVHAYSAIGSGQTLSFTYTGGGCGTTAMSWDGAKYVGSCNTPSGWIATDTVTVSNTTTASGLDNETTKVSGFVAALAVNDNLNGYVNLTIGLPVMANDQGSEIQIESINDSNLNSNCTVAINGSNVDLTCGPATGAMGSFGYTIADMMGGLSSATVTVTATDNTSPSLLVSEPDGVSDAYFIGDTVTITYSLSDSEEAVTAAFAYDTDNAGQDGVALAGACAIAGEGTDVTCAWNTTGMATGSYYFYGVVSDGVNPAVSAYSSGQVTLIAPVSLVSPAARLATSGGGTNSISATYTAGAGSERLALISVAWDASSGEADSSETLTGTYGGQTISQVTVSRSSDGRQGVWVGYVDEARLLAKSGDAIALSFDGDGNIPEYASIAALTMNGAGQIAPVAVTANGTSGSSYAWSGLAVQNQGYVVYAVNGESGTGSFTPPAGYNERFDNQLNTHWTYSMGDKAIAASGTEAQTVTFSTSARWALAAVAVGPNLDNPPTLSIAQPDGVSDSVNAGNTYNIIYTLSDPDEVVTAAFYYDTDASGLNGVAITGPCETAAEGTGVTCAWDTTGMAPGQYYVYAVTTDAINPAVSAYSKGRLTINPNAAPTISISQPDGTGDTVIKGASYNITYTLADTDNVVTAAFYYDSNNSGLDGTAITGPCATAGEGSTATCAWDTTTMPTGQYYVYAIVNDGINPAVTRYSSGRITINANPAPTLSISQPNGVGDTVVAGTTYNITYTLADSNNTVTAAFYYDTDNSGLNGTAIAGACAAASEGTSVTCAWNTAGVTPGQYYVYGVVSDGVNPEVSAYSTGQITIDPNQAPTLAVGQPDGVNDTITAGSAYNITYTLADSDNTVTAAFYYDTDNSGLNGTAIAGTCAAAAEGAGIVCSWSTTGLAAGSYYVYGIVNDGSNPAVSAYSAGPVTVITPVSVAGAAARLTTSGAGTNTITASYTAGAGSNRIVQITVAWETSSSEADTNETLSGTYGGETITQVAVSRSADGRQGVWVGYVDEARLAAKSGNTISLNFDGDGLIPDRSPSIAATTYAAASQAAPTAVTANGTSGTAFSWSGLAVATGSYVLYAASADGTGVFDPPPPGGTNSFTERFDTQVSSNYQYTVGDRAITAGGTSAETLTCSLSSGHWALIAVAVEPN